MIRQGNSPPLGAPAPSPAHLSIPTGLSYLETQQVLPSAHHFPPPAALDGPLLHTSLVHPPRLTDQLSTFSTRPHIPCRRGRRRSQESHLVSARRPCMTRPPLRVRNALAPQPIAVTMRRVSSAPQDGHHHEPHRFPTFATSCLGATQEPTRSVRTNRHPGSAGALASPSLHSGQPLLTGNPASLAIRASPAPAAFDGPLLHASLVHPPRLTAKLSARATPPHVPCRRGRRRSQEGHHHELGTVPTFAPSGLGATQEPTRSVRANRHPWERRRPRRPISPFRPASPSWKYRKSCHPRITPPPQPSMAHFSTPALFTHPD